MKFTESSGQVARTVIIMVFVILCAGLLVYVGLSLARGRGAATNTVPEVVEEPKPVYQAQMGDIEIKLVSARNLGSFIPDTKTGFKQDLKTTEKFIQVVITAQNKGKVNTPGYDWGMNDIIDSEERVFNQVGNAAYYFLPQPDLCGAMLKPEFAPTVCVRLFEVAKSSDKLKVKVFGPQKEGEEPVYLDLPVTP